MSRELSLSALTAISPVDGRYGTKTAALRDAFSEYALIRERVRVEIEWLKALAAAPGIEELPAFSAAEVVQLDAIVEQFDVDAAAAVKAIEATTNHDVKAVEYFIKQRMASLPSLATASEFVHFGCTSEDINLSLIHI